jgi:hypothetical protein
VVERVSHKTRAVARTRAVCVVGYLMSMRKEKKVENGMLTKRVDVVYEMSVRERLMFLGVKIG